MKAEIDQNANAVEIRLGQSTYLLTADAYAALAAAIFDNPPKDVVWQARITKDMVSRVTDIENMIEELNNDVAGTAMEFGVN